MAAIRFSDPLRGTISSVSDATPVPISEGRIELPDGRTLGYAEFGDPEGDTLLWFHGTPGARLQVPPGLGPEAAARGFRVFTIERPGNGESTPHLYRTLRDFAPDIEAFADAHGVDRFGLIGLSGGGPYVLAVAHELPHRVVVGAVLGGLGPVQGPETAPGYTRLLGYISPMLDVVRGSLAWLFSNGLRQLRPVADQGVWLYMRFGPPGDRAIFENPEMQAMFKNDFLRGLEGGMRGPIYDLALFARDWGFSLRDIVVPIRFWQGDSDLIVPFAHGEHQASLVPDGQLFPRPGEGHFAGFSAIDLVLDELQACWAEGKHEDLTA
jgi:pimeloyl-ACP methyl ester carboxylesterase